MYFLPTGRNQRPRGFHVKQGFQFTLISVVCICLLYQTKHLNDRKGDRSLQAEFGKGNSVVSLGRKGDVELKDKSMYTSDSEDVILESEGKQKDRGGGEEELNLNIDEVANESLGKGSEDIYEHVKADAEEKKMEPERQYDLSTNSGITEIEMRDKDNEVFSEDNSQGLENSERISSLDGGGHEKNQRRQIISDARGRKSGANSLVQRGDDKDLERQTKELQRDVEVSTDPPKQGKDETASSGENGDKQFRGKEITKQVNGAENATIPGLNEVANLLHGFHDENGVPQGGNDLVEFTLAKSGDGQPKDILHQRTTSIFNHRSKINRSRQIDEGASKSARNITDLKPLRAKKKAEKVMQY